MNEDASRYGNSGRPNIGALLMSGLLVGGLLSSFLALNMVTVHKQLHAPTIVSMLEQPKPPPPPAKQAAEPVKETKVATPVVAPVPIVQTPPNPAPIATTSVPPPPMITVPGPPSSSPVVAPSPAIESVGDLSSKMIAADPPRYPNESRRKHEEGTVLLTVLVAIDGSVADISVARSSGFDRLDRAALSAVRRWKWSPTRRSGEAVMIRGVVEIPFILKS
ncbi:TonB family protein [Sphingobium sp. PAMC28499]|nr:TonB family protein [Sphingobium sp. PAMC28499]